MTTDSTLQQRIGVGVLLFSDGKLLLGKRSGSHGAGTWGLPGGHLEPGEEVSDCAIRETQEETGLIVSDIRHVDFTNDLFEADKKQYITLFVEAKSFTGTVKRLEPEQCKEWRWFSASELPDTLFKPLQTLFDQGYRFSANTE